METVTFQALSWHGSDRDVLEYDEKGGRNTTKYIIDIFGKTLQGQSVCLHVPFKPRFFIEISRKLAKHEVSAFVTQIMHADNRGKMRDLADCRMVMKKRFMGFTNNTPCPFLVLMFESLSACTMAQKRLAPFMAGGHKRIDMCRLVAFYETNIDPLLRLMHIRQLQSVGWIEARGDATSDMECITRCDRELNCTDSDLRPVQSEDIAPFVMASFDLECISPGGGFPNATHTDSQIIQIATCFHRIVDADAHIYRREIHCLSVTDANPETQNVDIRCYTDELSLIEGWIDGVQAQKSDIYLGYNTFGFDNAYIYKRLVIHGGALNPHVTRILRKFSRYSDHSMTLREIKTSTQQRGAREYVMFVAPGVLQLDVYLIIRTEKTLSSYTLKDVSKKYLAETKKEAPIDNLYAYWQQSPTTRGHIAEYCVRDTELPIQLVVKLAIRENLFEMARAVCIPIDWLVYRGQQVKVYSLLCQHARTAGYLVPTITIDPNVQVDKYEGATVLEPVTGAYFKPIATLDFASLYPSIMRAHNLCHTTLVIDPKYANIPGVHYLDVIISDTLTSRFAKNVESVLPHLLSSLAQYRSDAKKLMGAAKASGDSARYAIMNGRQLAYKVTMNSIYGFCGAAKQGFLPCVPVAASVTSLGRQMLAQTRDNILTHYPKARVVYGDSVPGYTPCIVRTLDGTLRTETLETLAHLVGDGWEYTLDGKEICVVPSDAHLYSLTEDGFTPILHIIRHHYRGPIVRVSCNAGFVDCTPHHSLVQTDRTPIKPSQCVPYSTKLLTTYIGRKLVALNPCSDVLCSSVVWEQHAVSALPYAAYTYNNPAIMKKTVLEVFGSIGTFAKFTQRAALQMVLVAHKLGCGWRSSACDDTKYVDMRLDVESVHGDTVTSVHNVCAWNGLVYDISTESHHFHAGVGGIVVHNTDSVFIDFDEPDMQSTFTVAQEASERITDVFVKPNELEFEKVYNPFFLYKKKKYAGLMYTQVSEADKVDVKGLTIVRRDSCELVRRTCKAVMELLMLAKDVDGALALIRKTISDLMTNQVVLSDLVLTQSLRSLDVNETGADGAYKSALLPHLTVANNINARSDVGELYYNSGDRVPYVFVEGSSLTKHSLLVSHPDVVERDGKRVDALFYIEHQLHNPIMDLIGVVIDEAQTHDLFDLSRYDKELKARAARIKAMDKVILDQRHRTRAEENERARVDFIRKFYGPKS